MFLFNGKLTCFIIIVFVSFFFRFANKFYLLFFYRKKLQAQKLYIFINIEKFFFNYSLFPRLFHRVNFLFHCWLGSTYFVMFANVLGNITFLSPLKNITFHVMFNYFSMCMDVRSVRVLLSAYKTSTRESKTISEESCLCKKENIDT